ncbi:MAG: DUF971 domain-containing protein [Gammaproteobacteria bacterium]|nr:DUF971 domain-containing protein [Gammaproteobacteria bacterium]
MRGNQMSTPAIEEIKLRVQSRLLEVSFADGTRYELPFEYLRVHSPSAEVQGHAPGQAALVVGKQDVRVTGVEPIGNYAVRLLFDDGHDTGLYTFAYLQELGAQQQDKWRDYQRRVEASKRKAGH